jgi:hypothetical protein
MMSIAVSSHNVSPVFLTQCSSKNCRIPRSNSCLEPKPVFNSAFPTTLSMYRCKILSITRTRASRLTQKYKKFVFRAIYVLDRGASAPTESAFMLSLLYSARDSGRRMNIHVHEPASSFGALSYSKVE